jgi:hypothetical protein
MENDELPHIEIRASIKPEDLFYASAYLLFSDKRDREREHAGKIERAFMESNFAPKRLVVLENVMVLECKGPAPLLYHDRYGSAIDNMFTRVLVESVVRISAGIVPPLILGENVNNRTYNFVTNTSG